MISIPNVHGGHTSLSRSIAWVSSFSRFVHPWSTGIRRDSFTRYAKNLATKKPMQHAFLYSTKTSIQLKRCHPTTRHLSTTSSGGLPEMEHVVNDETVYNDLRDISTRIQHHDYLYYTPGLQVNITDEEYDALTRREEVLCKSHPKVLKRLEEESGLGWRFSRYGGRVGPIVSSRDKLEHIREEPMLSLDNAMEPSHVVKWVNRVKKLLFARQLDASDDDDNILTLSVGAEPKIDGLSLSLRYILNGEDKYVLQWGATRGDGTKGEDVTEAVVHMMDDGEKKPKKSRTSIPKSFNASDVNPPTEFDTLPSIIEVRGEIVLPTSTFKEMNHSANAEGAVTLKQFSNARNAASGILLRRKAQSEMTVEEVAETRLLRSHLEFYAYSLVTSAVHDQLTEFDPHDGKELYRILERLGFTVPSPTRVVELALKKDVEVVETECQNLFDYHDEIMANRLSMRDDKPNSCFDYDIDGTVYKVTSAKDRELLGSSARAPRWALAHKPLADCAITKLKSVEIQVGRTGSLTPVAILEPVVIAGVTIRRATLHNFKHAQYVLKAAEDSADDDGTKIGVYNGTSLLISRAGDVIPQVVKRVDNDDENLTGKDFISLEPPMHCPGCGAEVMYDDQSRSRSSVGEVIRCSGPQILCPPRATSALAHAFSRDALNINGLSEARLKQLMDAKIVQFPSDVFNIVDAEMVDKVSSLPGWGLKSATNLKESILDAKKKRLSLQRYIYSLGIRNVGLHSSSLIASAYNDVEEFLSEIDTASQELRNNMESDRDNQSFSRLLEIPGIGPTIRDSLLSFSKEKELVKASRSLAGKVCIEKGLDTMAATDMNIGKTKPFHEKKIVFSGSLPEGLTRRKAQDLARRLGGSTPASLNKQTSILVLGEKGGKKELKAKEWGVQIMRAEDFLSILREHGFIDSPTELNE